MGGKDANRYWINGKEGEKLDQPKSILADKISGRAIRFSTQSEKSREFVIDLNVRSEEFDEGEIALTTWNAFVRITVNPGSNENNFINSTGLMGRFTDGAKLGRDGVTIIEDNDVFGQEWQVVPSEGELFQSNEGPQYPEKCEIPSTIEMRRRLAENTVTIIDAQNACSRVMAHDYDTCVFDVLATNDKNTAGAY